MQTPSSPASKPAQRRNGIDVRRRALAITAVTTVVLGALLAWEPHAPSAQSQPDLRFADLLKLKPRMLNNAGEVSTRFQQGVAMLHMRQYEYALTAFHQVLALAPKMPEAHVNMGFALLGLEQWQGARDFFESAIELRRDQMNAYYGLAVALEELGDVPGAMGAMQAYLHRAAANDPFRARAESALWEWRTAKQDQSNAPSQPAVDTPR